MSAPEVFWLVVGFVAGLMVGHAAGLLVMGVVASGKVEDAERRLDEAGREADEQARRNVRWLSGPVGRTGPAIPAQVCLACRLGECTTHGGRS